MSVYDVKNIEITKIQIEKKENLTRFPDDSVPMSAEQLTCKLELESILTFLNCKIDFAIKT